MYIGVFGLSHRTAPVELREQVAFQGEELPRALEAVRRKCDIPECVILSTCNRVELYTLLPELNGHSAKLKEFLTRFHDLSPDFLGDRFYWYLQPDSVRHLFRVAAGLESMVVGESEILGQVREAYTRAVSCQSVGPVFHRLFQTAIRTGKEVRTKTRIGRGAVSVGSVAVELAKRIFQDLKRKTVLTLGAGSMGETTLQCLKGQGVGRILVANRSRESALPLAEVFGGEIFSLEELDRALVQADIVICSTGANRFLLHETEIRQAMVLRHQRPLFLIDISVPRNLDPAIGGLENVYLYDIDDLEGIASANLRMRMNEVHTCSRIIEERIDRFLERWNGRGPAG
ncbi:MAG: glutamyl-tRNA reductase [Candidatus Omnitrophica bacterium]|nr:glutamyl-tRNA reductase [Candidatus Omnitrophota bacterium]